MQRLIRTCWIAVFLAWLPAVLCALPAAAQTADRSVVRTAGEPTRLFATLDLPDGTDGLVLDLPRGWVVDDVSLLRYGSEPQSVTVQRESGAYRLTASAGLRGPHDVSFRVVPGPRTESAEWSVQPFRLENPETERIRRIGTSLRQTVRTVRPLDDAGDNRVLAFRGASVEPVVLHAGQVPALERSVSFTVEFWMSTIGLGEVVLSTWTGQEDRHYPFDMVIDPSGRLRYYCGQPGRHTSMSSNRPLADGRWHHVGVAYDADRRFLRLTIDGVAVDSVEQVSLPGGYLRPDIALGGRLPTRDVEPSPVFSGQLDLLRVWSSARTPMQIRQTMREGTVRTGPPDRSKRQPDVVTLTFDDAPPPRLVRQWPRDARRPRVPLQLRRSVHALRASTEGETVRLEWHADASTVMAFVVERSRDGTVFEKVDRLTPEDARPVTGQPDPRFTATDDPPGRVAYYRIREVFADGTSDVSGTFKVGVGPSIDPGEEGEEDTRIVRNYPNPFSGESTVEFHLAEAAPVQITLWDVSGKRLGVVYDRSHGAGQHTFSLRADDLPSGTYFLRLEAGEESDSHAVVVLK
ncbi:LamG-like jellyroll fold domain-containing protein [Longibacter sp.]|uniref:LamG-like jellyroll fold domain-containing protein n=1 Tax=Longibacter sp. TaxID=2045415 RepID=UPI003EB70801